MTGQSERIRESHRGSRIAEPASRSRLAALATFGLRFVQVDDFNVVVEGEYELNLAMSYWRAADGSSHGYLVSGLAAEIGRTRVVSESNSNPVADRENVQAELEAAVSHQHVESATGATSSVLPAVWP